MDSILNQINFWHWIGFAVILGTLDVMLGANFVLLWCGIAAAIVGVILAIFPNLSWEYQWLLFGFGVFTSLLYWVKFLKKRKAISDKPHLNMRAMQYVNREFTLDQPIVNGRGKVKVDDTSWVVEGDDLPVGTKIKVVDVHGVILKVEKAK